METTTLPPRLQKLIDIGESGTDILHGELKSLILEAEEEMSSLSESQDQPAYKYAEGKLDAYLNVYALTYQLAFAISDRRAKLTN